MTCGIKTDHTLWCWGQDQYPTEAQHLVPTMVGNDATWVSLSMATTPATAGLTTCAIKLDGTLWCWGALLADGGIITSVAPVQVGTATDWKSVSVGGEICATRTGGTLWCWANSFALGNGMPTYDQTGNVAPTATPTQIGSDTDWNTAVTSGNLGTESCAVKNDGSLWCWGVGAAPVPGIVPTPVPIN
jgi:hypothetical protein